MTQQYSPLLSPLLLESWAQVATTRNSSSLVSVSDISLSKMLTSRFQFDVFPVKGWSSFSTELREDGFQVWTVSQHQPPLCWRDGRPQGLACYAKQELSSGWGVGSGFRKRLYWGDYAKRGFRSNVSGLGRTPGLAAGNLGPDSLLSQTPTQLTRRICRPSTCIQLPHLHISPALSLFMLLAPIPTHPRCGQVCDKTWHVDIGSCQPPAKCLRLRPTVGQFLANLRPF